MKNYEIKKLFDLEPGFHNRFEIKSENNILITVDKNNVSFEHNPPNENSTFFQIELNIFEQLIYELKRSGPIINNGKHFHITSLIENIEFTTNIKKVLYSNVINYNEIATILYNDILKVPITENIKNNIVSVINLDGSPGYTSLFLKTLFGLLQKNHNFLKDLRLLEIVSNEEPYLILECIQYMKEERDVR